MEVLCSYSDTCEPCIRRWREKLDYGEIDKAKLEKLEMTAESLMKAQELFKTESDAINECYKKSKKKEMTPKARNEVVKHLMKLQDALEIMENPFINVERMRTEMIKDPSTSDSVNPMDSGTFLRNKCKFTLTEFS